MGSSKAYFLLHSAFVRFFIENAIVHRFHHRPGQRRQPAVSDAVKRAKVGIADGNCRVAGHLGAEVRQRRSSLTVRLMRPTPPCGSVMIWHRYSPGLGLLGQNVPALNHVLAAVPRFEERQQTGLFECPLAGALKSPARRCAGPRPTSEASRRRRLVAASGSVRSITSSTRPPRKSLRRPRASW